MRVGYFEKNAAVMKLISLFGILSMVLPISVASAATELETLRARCIEQERQIQQLEAQLVKLQPESTQLESTQPAAVPAAIVVTETPTAPSGKTHKIQEGETYSHISRKYKVSIESLVAANPSVKPTALRPGQIIRLSSDAPAAAAPTLQPAALASNSPASPFAKTESTATAPPANVASAEKKIRSVMIETEITYAAFATQYGTDTGRLNDLNGLDLTESTVLAKGSELYVPQ